MDKITEEVITSLIKRIEGLESDVRSLKQNKPNNSNVSNNKDHRPGMVTPGQINYIKGLGGEVWPDMTSKEASEYIDKLKVQKEKGEQRPNTGGPVGQALMDPNIKDSSREYSENKALTQEEIDELGEEAFL